MVIFVNYCGYRKITIIMNSKVIISINIHISNRNRNRNNLIRIITYFPQSLDLKKGKTRTYFTQNNSTAALVVVASVGADFSQVMKPLLSSAKIIMIELFHTLNSEFTDSPVARVMGSRYSPISINSMILYNCTK